MTLAAVRGQPRAIDRLRAALARGTVHHAYLFVGPEGVGKELAARGVAQALLCPERPNEGCGECSTCVRVERGNHPDVLVVMPEAELVERGRAARADFSHTPSRDLKVEQVRTLQERLALRALEAPRKIAILLSAERMNEPAQNAFLKTLEEPPADTTLILVSASADLLLPTIRSRCAQIAFGPLPRPVLVEALAAQKKLEPGTAELVAEIAGGSLGRALAMDVDFLASRKEVVEAFEKLKPGDARPALAFAEAFGGARDDAENALSLLRLWIRDLLVLKAGSEEIAQRDLLPLARQAAAKHTELELLEAQRWIERTRYRIGERNGSPRLQLERMLIALSEGS